MITKSNYFLVIGIQVIGQHDSCLGQEKYSINNGYKITYRTLF